jgi:hypothetical protein
MDSKRQFVSIPRKTVETMTSCFFEGGFWEASGRNIDSGVLDAERFDG